MNFKRRNFWAGIIGNILDHYDMALYGLMAAFIAPNFFPSDDHLVSIIKTYGVMAIGLFTRPAGALIFGRMAMHAGSKKVMIICLSGVAVCTGLIGLIPSYEQIGGIGTTLFILIRLLQGLFAAGESVVASFFVIKNASTEHNTRTSGYYNCSTMFGVVIASCTATIVSYSSKPTFYWRYAFIAGFITAIAGLYLRSFITQNEEEVTQPKLPLQDIAVLIKKHKTEIIRIILVSSFSYITYTIPFVFMNNFIPSLTDIKLGEMLKYNSILLVLDTSLIPVFGIIAERFNRTRFMAFMSGAVAIIIIPLFYYLPGSSLFYVMVVRLFVILLGLAYLAPLQAWYYELFKGPERYLMVGIGYSIAQELLGKNSTTICLSLWYYFKHPIAPALYIAFVALLAACALLYKKAEHKIN